MLKIRQWYRCHYQIVQFMYLIGMNVEWKHGILQMSPDNLIEEGRISIIAWGWVEMKDK